MAQIFRPSTNTIARASIVAVVVLLGAGSWLAYALIRSPYGTDVGVPYAQPVPFSHKHHVTDDGIDCRYCHTTVETSAYAGIPPTETCMNCHRVLFTDSAMLEPVRESWRTGEPVHWVRVHRLQEFVYFNHSIHIAKGMGCSACHGRIDLMPIAYKENTLYMEWCLACHRNPEQFVRPRDQVFNMTYEPPADQLTLGRKLVADYKIERLTSCSNCHR